MTDKIADLKPCPFCGGAPELYLGRGAWGVKCTCDGKAFIHTYGGGFVSTGVSRDQARANAVEAWNILALDAREAGGWQPIETAPDFERVIVAGWQPKNGTVAGYWWMHEDDIVAGRPPSALLWHPFPMPPPDHPSRLLNKEDRNG